ncbi:MAG: dipeptidase [Phenylobacterium sp.]|uniref:dipeptidase n=1 Tax=Phenylobacterium sp. TaxID=1871053 RepID=UPI003016807A
MPPRPALLASLCLSALLSLSVTAPAYPASPDPRRVHEAAVVLDTHFDTPANLGRPGWSILDRHDTARDGSQVDLPRMIEGGVDGGFFAVFTPQGARGAAGNAAARDHALYRASEIREMVARHSDRFALALTADDPARILAARKRFVFMSMENGSPVAGDLSLMQAFYRLGVRMIGPVHFRNSDLADSATDTPEWGGLSPAGRSFVAEANRLGMVIDASHASDASLDQMIALSEAPLILSHSGCKDVFDHPRNVDDARLRALAAKGGVIQINAFSAYMVPTPRIPEREAALKDLAKSLGVSGQDMTDGQRKGFTEGRKSIDARWPVPRANIDDFMKHMLHALAVIGPDHVGVSGDFDGGGGIDGLNDVSDYPEITRRLLAAGYSPADINKIWSGNALRVLKTAEAVRDRLQTPKAD